MCLTTLPPRFWLIGKRESGDNRTSAFSRESEFHKSLEYRVYSPEPNGEWLWRELRKGSQLFGRQLGGVVSWREAERDPQPREARIGVNAVAGKTSKKSTKVAKKAVAKRSGAKPVLLAGGNPQIAKVYGTTGGLSTRPIISRASSGGSVSARRPPTWESRSATVSRSALSAR